MMNTPKPALSALFFLISTITSFNLSYCLRNTTIFCPDIENHSLLNLKQSLKDPHNILSSWDSEVNCCKWEGVTCSNSTGHVHQLHLHGLGGTINPSLLNLKHLTHLDLSRNNFPETIPSFIGSFASLEYLNLSQAGFHGKIPLNIGNLSYLHTLGLANTGVEVDSLDWLLGLSRLEYLNMIGVDLGRATNWAQVINSLPSLAELHFASCSLDSMSSLNDVNLTSLAFLDLSHNKFQSITIPGWIFQLANLLSLDLSYNDFVGPIPAVSNTTKLRYIDLSRNQLDSSIPDWLYFCKDLEFVYFSDNLLRGGVSEAIANLTSLNTFDLFGNRLSGKIPREISNLCKLQFLLFTYNEFQGELSDSFGNMSECFLGSITLLCLRNNRLSGRVIDQFGEFKRIAHLHFGGNSFSGAIPISLGKLSSLIELSMYGNKFTGNLPESFSQLVNLQELYIDDNMLDGIMTESHFSNLTKLRTFSASGNLLTLNVSPNWIPTFQLRTLRLGSWNLGLGSQVPLWLEKQKSIWELDLSNTGISGRVPLEFWKIKFLNLSHNHLHGEIPYIHRPQFVYLSSNQFSGPLPRIANSVRELDLSNNSFSRGISHFLCDETYETYGLQVLHLGGNQLSGILPDCWVKWPKLKYLNIGNNFMSGSIPNSIGYLTFLMSLNLYGNNLSGQMPSSMRNCTELQKIELANNDLDGNLPAWVGTSLVKLKFLILRTNKLSGKIPLKICHLNSLQILDLSDNKFSGTIPECVYNFTSMATKRDLAKYDYSFLSYWRVVFIDSAIVATKGSQLQYDTVLSLVTSIDLSLNNLSGNIPKELTRLMELRSLNLSGNHLTGSIPDNIGDMAQLESLDFSMNSLSGGIPNSFERMSYLSRLNLSSNNLTGRIPESTQLQSLDASSFTGNDLCGPPLTNRCSNDGGDALEHQEENEGDESEIEWLYVFVSLGYAVGFSGLCTTLVLKKSWREAYFGFIEDMWGKLCVYCRPLKVKPFVSPSS